MKQESSKNKSTLERNLVNPIFFKVTLASFACMFALIAAGFAWSIDRAPEAESRFVASTCAQIENQPLFAEKMKNNKDLTAILQKCGQ